MQKLDLSSAHVCLAGRCPLMESKAGTLRPINFYKNTFLKIVIIHKIDLENNTIMCYFVHGGVAGPARTDEYASGADRKAST